MISKGSYKPFFIMVLAKMLIIWYSIKCYGGVGEVVNTADCGSVMQGFDSLIPPQFRIKRFFLKDSFFLIKCYNSIY